MDQIQAFTFEGSLAQHLEAIGASIAALGQEIAPYARNPVSRLLAGIPGIGMLAASAIAASVPDPKVFKPGRDLSASPGSTPRQNSSGGKEKPGATTKRATGRLLVLGGAIAASDIAEGPPRCCAGQANAPALP